MVHTQREGFYEEFDMIYNEIVMRFRRLNHFPEKYLKNKLLVPRCKLHTKADMWGP
jgi:hypothetical protein